MMSMTGWARRVYAVEIALVSCPVFASAVSNTPQIIYFHHCVDVSVLF